MSVLRRVAPLAGLLAAEVAAIAALHAIAGQGWTQVTWSDLGGWVAATPPVDAAMAAVRLLALAVAWWLLATTALAVLAALARARTLAAIARATTWSLVRATVDRAAVTGVSAALLLPSLPVGAEVAAPPPPGLGAPAVLAPDDAAEPAGPNEATEDAGEADRGEKQRPRTHTVRPGEHLWAIAAADVAAAGDDLGDDGVVAAHWRALIERNSDVLRSGDADLVFPGERLELPDPPR